MRFNLSSILKKNIIVLLLFSVAFNLSIFHVYDELSLNRDKENCLRCIKDSSSDEDILIYNCEEKDCKSPLHHHHPVGKHNLDHCKICQDFQKIFTLQIENRLNKCELGEIVVTFQDSVFERENSNQFYARAPPQLV